jgi:hypothetical protein
MRVSKFLPAIIFITLLCLLYVWQQTEIFRLAYVAQKHESVFQNLLDKNTVLRYNIKSNSSLIRICNKFSTQTDFEMPDNYHLVRLEYYKENLRLAQSQSNKESIISRIFGIKRQAEAKTVKSPNPLMVGSD